MKLKAIFTNLFISSISVYIALLIFSSYDYFFIYNRRIVGKEIRDLKHINEEITQKIAALNSGYLPIIYPFVHFQNDKTLAIYPIGPMPYRRTYLCDEGYGLITYLGDRFGLRNSDSKWSEVNKQSNIFVIGDSFVHGACVPDNSTIPSNIERSTGLNTLNLGTGGNGPHEYRAILKSIVSPIIKESINENIVVLIFYINDSSPPGGVVQLEKEKLLNSLTSIIKDSPSKGVLPTDYYHNNLISLIKESYPQSPQELILSLKDQKKSKEKDLKISRWEESYFYYIGTFVPVRTRLKELLKEFSGKISLTPSERSISLLADICQDLCKPIVAYIPNNPFLEYHPKHKIFKIELKEMSKRMGITFIDGETVIDRKNPNDYAPKGVHLSIEGYTKMADLISDKIKD